MAAARSREFERKENYEPKEACLVRFFRFTEIDVSYLSIELELFQNLASGLTTIDFNPAVELLAFDEDIDSSIRRQSDPNLSIALEIDFVSSKME